MEFPVKTNMYQAELTIKEDTSDNYWYQYKIDICPMKRVREKDIGENGKAPPTSSLTAAHEEKVQRFQRRLENRGSNPQSRKLLHQLSDELQCEGKYLAVSRPCSGVQDDPTNSHLFLSLCILVDGWSFFRIFPASTF